MNLRRVPLPNGPLSAVVLLWGINFVSIKIVYAEMTPRALSVVRFLVMWACLAGWCRLRGLRVQADRPERLRILGAGAMSMGVYMVLFLEGMRLTAPAEGAICLATAPVLTYFLSALRGQEPWRASVLLATLGAFAGVALVVGGRGARGLHVQGDLLVLASAVCWAWSAMQMRPLLQRHAPLPLFTASLPGGLPILLLYGGRDALAFRFSQLSPTGWLHFVQIALGSGVGAFVLFYRGVSEVGAAGATSYQFLVPLVAAFFGWALLGSTLAPVQIVGIVVVLASLAVLARERAAARR